MRFHLQIYLYWLGNTYLNSFIFSTGSKHKPISQYILVEVYIVQFQYNILSTLISASKVIFRTLNLRLLFFWVNSLTHYLMDANRINKQIIKMTLLLRNSLGTHRKNQSIANNAASKVSDIPANWMATVNKLIEIYVIEK